MNTRLYTCFFQISAVYQLFTRLRDGVKVAVGVSKGGGVASLMPELPLYEVYLSTYTYLFFFMPLILKIDKVTSLRVLECSESYQS